MVELKMVVKFSGDAVMANTDYVLENGSYRVENKTDDQGNLVEKIPTNIKCLNAVFKPKDNPEVSCRIDIGQLDPYDEVSGLQQRLNNLGYYSRALDDEYGPLSDEAVKDFQIDNGIDPKNGLDQQTINLINDLYENKG